MADEWVLADDQEDDEWVPVAAPTPVVPEEPSYMSRVGQNFVDTGKGLFNLGVGGVNYLRDAWDHGPVDAAIERLPSDPTSYLDFIGRAGAETAGGAAGATLAPYTLGLSIPAGATLGGYGYDLLNYFVGNTSKAPDTAALPASMFVNTLAGPVASKTSEVVGSGLGKLGNYVEDLYDPTRAMRGAINPNWAHYKPGPGQLPLDEAIQKGVSSGMIDPKTYAGSRTPFTDMANDLYGQMDTLAPGNMSTLDLAGKQVEVAASKIPGTIPYSQIDPRKLLPDNVIAAETASLNRGIGNAQYKQDMELFAKTKGATPDEATKFAELGGYGSGEDVTSRVIRKLADPITPDPLTAPQVIERARAFSDPSVWGGVPDSPKANAYRSMEGQTRGAVRSLAEEAGPEVSKNFTDANANYQTMATLKDSIEARKLQEMQPVQGPTLRGYVSVLNPFNWRAASMAGPRQTAKDARKLLRVAAGESFGQTSGLASKGSSLLQGLGEAGQFVGRNPAMGIGLTEAFSQGEEMNGTALQGLSLPSVVSPALADDGRPQGVKPSVPMSFQPDERAGNVPRHILAVDARMVGSFLNQYVAPDDIQPLAMQAMKVFGSKDNKEIGRFLGALAEKYPDMPFERGPITGLPSEWQMDDGSTKLFSDIDVQRWAQEIETSPIREDEKAQRLRALRTDGTVYPLDRKLNDFGPPLMSDSAMNSAQSPMDIALQNLMAQNQFTPRRQTPLGSVKMEY